MGIQPSCEPVMLQVPSQSHPGGFTASIDNCAWGCKGCKLTSNIDSCARAMVLVALEWSLVLFTLERQEI